MTIGRRELLTGIGAAGVAGGFATFAPAPARAEWSGGGERTHAHSLLGAPKYGPDVAHLDYVDPAAPKGGRVRMASLGRGFDTFNPFISKGDSFAGGDPTGRDGLRLVFETLMRASLDEGSTHYGAIAEWMEAPSDQSWTAFRLREGARWHDGRPITVDDVIYSFQLFKEKAASFYQSYYANVTEAVDEGDRIVRFVFEQGGNRELPHIIGQLTVLPKHWWETRDFENVTLEPPLGSGPYRISKFEAGQYVELARVDDYWGRDLPHNVGQNNFDTLHYSIFLDREAGFEAFKRGQLDYWWENSASRWAERFEFPALTRGHVEKHTVALEGPQSVQGFVFNLRDPRFADRRVREAFALAYDFEYMNRAVFFGQYARPKSYFEGSADLMATGLPDAAELALLAPHRDALPPALFEQPYSDPVSDGSGRIRRRIAQGGALLEAAGWGLDRGVRVDADGAPFEVEFLTSAPTMDRIISPFARNLERMGVQLSLRTVDAAQFANRLRDFDFEMTSQLWSNSESPGNEQRDFWASSEVDAIGARNRAGVQNPVLDDLIEKIILAEDRSALAAASRALDRVLLWERYSVLYLYSPYDRFALWRKFGAPESPPSRAIGFPNVYWWDAEKAEKL